MQLNELRWQDPNTKTYLEHCLVYLGWWWRTPERPQCNVVGIAAICSIVAITITLLLLLGIDRLARVEMTSVGFPIAVGCSIICFSIYSGLIMSEQFSHWHAIGPAIKRNYWHCFKRVKILVDIIFSISYIKVY